jgi:collagen type III alpha
MPRTTFLRGHELINVAGESHYQDALTTLAGATEGEVRLDATAHLIPEPENEHDRNAVRVEIGGHKVGYLPRAVAAAYAPALAPIAARGRIAACEALVAGRDPSAMLGVFLRLPPADDPLLRDDPSRRL